MELTDSKKEFRSNWGGSFFWSIIFFYYYCFILILSIFIITPNTALKEVLPKTGLILLIPLLIFTPVLLIQTIVSRKRGMIVTVATDEKIKLGNREVKYEDLVSIEYKVGCIVKNSFPRRVEGRMVIHWKNESNNAQQKYVYIELNKAPMSLYIYLKRKSPSANFSITRLWIWLFWVPLALTIAFSLSRLVLQLA